MIWQFVGTFSGGGEIEQPEELLNQISEKERISDAILAAKDDLITHMFSPAQEQAQFVPEDEEA